LLTEFLTGRFQCTVINKVKSLCEPVISGVPQGCVLGPIIFILFLNDLPQYVNSFSPGSADSLKMYANDIKIYCIVNTLYQAINFQKTINIISDWCRTWQLTVNISKSSVLHLGRSSLKSSYVVSNCGISVQSFVMDLCIIIDNDLTFTPHINSSISKARIHCAVFLKSFASQKKIS